jgi:hypothetical protein
LFVWFDLQGALRRSGCGLNVRRSKASVIDRNELRFVVAWRAMRCARFWG